MVNAPKSNQENSDELNKGKPFYGNTVIDGEQKFSLLRSNGEGYKIGDIPLIITEVDGKIATIVNPDLDFDQDSDSNLNNEKQYIKILWENDEPVVISINKSGHNFVLLLDESEIQDENSKTKKTKIDIYSLINLKYGFALGQPGYDINDILPKNIIYPLEYIDEDNIVVEKNNSFYKTFNAKICKTSIFKKTGDKFKKIGIEGEKSVDSEKIEKLPSTKELTLYGGKLLYWNEQENIFKFIEFNGEILTGVSRYFEVHENRFVLEKEGKSTIFTVLKNNPLELSSLKINGTNILADQYEDEGEIEIIIKGYPIKLKDNPKKYSVKGYEFIEGEYVNGEKTYTDGKDLYSFLINEKGEIKTLKYVGFDYPILQNETIKDISNDQNNEFHSIAYVNDTRVEILHMIEKKNVGEEKDSKIINLQFDGELKDKNIIKIYPEHGVICLANDPDNTSQFNFYRINPDGSLDFVFINNYNINFKNNKVILHQNYELVRRPGTSSIFDTINFNGEEFFTVKTISISDNKKVKLLRLEPKLEILDIDIDQKTFLPEKLFEFEGETLYYSLFDGEKSENEENINSPCGKIFLRNRYYYFSNQKGEKISNPNDAIIETGGKKLLLLIAKESFFDDEIIVYSPNSNKNDEILNVEYFFVNDGISHKEKKEVKSLFIGDDKYICKYLYKIEKIFGIYEVIDNKLSIRYIYSKKAESVKFSSDGGNVEKQYDEFEGKEFTCDGQVVYINELLSSNYLKGTDGSIYYRKGYGSKLEKKEFPEGISFGEIPFVEIDDVAYRLKIKNGDLVQISQEYPNFYEMESGKINTEINGEAIELVNVWDLNNKREVSFIINKDGKKVPLKFGGNELDFKIRDGVIKVYGEGKPKYFRFGFNLEIVNIGNKKNSGLLLENEYFGGKFRYIFNFNTQEQDIYPIYEINGRKTIVETEQKITSSHKGNILINGIKYSEEGILSFYEINRPNSDFPEDVVLDTGESVDQIVSKKE